MPDLFPLPLEPVTNHTQVSNSHFETALSPARTVEAARHFIDLQKEHHPKANHHVSAFLIGHGSTTISHCTDDGEPSATAGKPALAVLEGSGLGDVVVVVSRYFGGTKLGTGGLVKAYGDAVRQVLKKVKIAYKIPTCTLHFQLPYHLYAQLESLLQSYHAQVKARDFSENVTLTIQIPASYLQQFQNQLRDLSNGQVIPQEIAYHPDTIVPADYLSENI